MRHTHGGKRAAGPGKKIGRPKTDTPIRKVVKAVLVNFEPETLEALDAYANALDLNRTEALHQALKYQPQPPRKLLQVVRNRDGSIMAIYAGGFVFNLTIGAWVPWDSLDLTEVIIEPVENEG